MIRECLCLALSPGPLTDEITRWQVVVPVAIPFLQPDGYKLNPFPVVRVDQSSVAWNLHRVPLDRLPVLNMTPANAGVVREWFNDHVSSQMSVRERALTKPARTGDTLNVLANIKNTLHAIMVRAAGTQGAPSARASRDLRAPHTPAPIWPVHQRAARHRL